MNLSSLALVIGIVSIGYAGILFKKKDPNYTSAAGVGAVFFLISYITNTSDTQKIEAYKTSLNKMESVLKNLGANIPVPTNASGAPLQCLEAVDDAAKQILSTNITNAINSITTAIAELQTLYGNLPDYEKTVQGPKFEDIKIQASAFSDTNRYSGALTNIRWNGLRPCIDICTTNTTPIKASYTSGGNCTCPARYYPTLDASNNIKCMDIDYTPQFAAFTSGLSALTSAISPPNIGSVPIKFACGTGTPCPSSMPILLPTKCTSTYTTGSTPTPATLPFTAVLNTSPSLTVNTSCSLLPRKVKLNLTIIGTGITQGTIAYIDFYNGASSSTSLIPPMETISVDTTKSITGIYDVRYPVSETASNKFIISLRSSVNTTITINSIQLMVTA